MDNGVLRGQKRSYRGQSIWNANETLKLGRQELPVLDLQRNWQKDAHFLDARGPAVSGYICKRWFESVQDALVWAES